MNGSLNSWRGGEAYRLVGVFILAIGAVLGQRLLNQLDKATETALLLQGKVDRLESRVEMLESKLGSVDSKVNVLVVDLTQRVERLTIMVGNVHTHPAPLQPSAPEQKALEKWQKR